MRRLIFTTLLAFAAGCGPSSKGSNTAASGPTDPDGKSGPDGKRSGAQKLKVNSPITDEVNFANGDKTDWFQVDLIGKAGVLNASVNWDQANSDVMIDVFDALGQQISASPVRGPGEQSKKLLTQIDTVPGTYYIRITAPTRADGTVYTLVAKWDEPPPVVVPPPPPDQPPPPPVEHHHHHEPKEKPVAEAPEGGSTLQGRIVQAYREGEGMMLQIDKGKGQGVRVGMSGTVLNGPAGEDALDGGKITITQVLGDGKSLAKCSLKSIGKNSRVAITLGK